MFQDRVAIVTASGRGMGKAIAASLASSGAKVVVCARTLCYGEETLAEFRRAGWEASLFQLDVTDHQAIRDVFDFAIRTYGGVDIVVHCAAEAGYGRIESLSDEDLDAAFTSIVDASFWLTQEAARRMQHEEGEPGGRLVFISSVAGNKIVLPGMAHYGAAKAALDAMVRAAAIELAPQNITVNAIEPGLILTTRALTHMTARQVEAIAEHIPVRRAGLNSDIVNAVRFLASAASSYVTGTSIVVDGGSHLAPIDFAEVLGADH